MLSVQNKNFLTIVFLVRVFDFGHNQKKTGKRRNWSVRRRIKLNSWWILIWRLWVTFGERRMQILFWASLAKLEYKWILVYKLIIIVDLFIIKKSTFSPPSSRNTNESWKSSQNKAYSQTIKMLNCPWKSITPSIRVRRTPR